MSTEHIGTEPCWYLHQENDDREWIAHYSTEAEARADLDPEDDHLTPRQGSHRCIRLTCDTCHLSMDAEGELTDTGMHIAPDELELWTDLHGWTTVDRDVHRCEECPTPLDPEDGEVEPVRDLSRAPGPDDIPLPLPDLEVIR